MTDRKIADNVRTFIDRAADLVAKVEAERFGQNMFCDLLLKGMASPIEDLFWIAMYAQCRANYEEFNPDEALSADGPVPVGVYVKPQVTIGRYRVDFLVTRVPLAKGQLVAPVIVELDGHDFHDKDKKQRAYEKARDRHFVKCGYQVLHYAGSEVVADPFKVAHEVLCLLKAASFPDYVAADPLGLG